MPATHITTANQNELQHMLTGKKVAIFAATMDPPTIGHDDILSQLCGLTTSDKNPVYDYIYIHTTENSPTGHYKSDTSPYALRQAMTHAAFRTKNRLLLSELHPLATVSWLMQIPDLHVTHVLGTDSLEWLQTISDHGEAVFFTGHSADGLKKSHPTATLTDPKTGEKHLFSGRGIYELETHKILIIQREDQPIPEQFLGIPTQKCSIAANTGHKRPISSTTIRALVKAGKYDDAKAMVAEGLRDTFDDYAWRY